MIHARHSGEVEVERDAVREDCREPSKCWGEGVRPRSKGEVRDVFKNTGNNPGRGTTAVGALTASPVGFVHWEVINDKVLCYQKNAMPVMGDWRDGSGMTSTCSSCTKLRFGFQHPHANLQPILTPVGAQLQCI